MQGNPNLESDEIAGAGEQEVFGLSVPLVREIGHALEDEAPERIHDLIFSLHVADIAELIKVLPEHQRQKFTQFFGGQIDPEVLTYLSPELRDEILSSLGRERTAAAIAQLDTDDAVHIIEDLSEAEQEEILEALPQESRDELKESLGYPDSSAGRLMRKEFVSVPEYWNVGQTIDYLRRNTNLPDDFYVIFVIDPKFRPVGVVMLSRIMHSGREVKVRDIMNDDIKPFLTTTDQEEVAYVFRKYGLVEAPVVGGNGKLVGVITVDDVVDVIQEEQEEDLMRLGGVIESDFHSGVRSTVIRRFTWLFINLLTAFAASHVISGFENAIDKIVTLAVLMPIIASMGGNAGIQAVTVAVRAITTRDLTYTNAAGFIIKEMKIGGVNGVLLALVTGSVVSLLWDVKLGLVFGAAMIINLLVAGVAGALLPLILLRMKVDPAIASGVFLTMITDITGFFAFLGLATLLLI